MDRSWSWLRCAVGFVCMTAAGCAGDAGDAARAAAGSSGSGGAAGAGEGAGRSAGGSSGTDVHAAGSGGDGGAEGGNGGERSDESGGAGVGDAGIGGADDGLAGGGGEDGGLPACTSGTCCFGNVCVSIPDGVHVSVTAASDEPDLGTGVAVVSEAVDVDFVHEPSEPVTLVATLDEPIDPQVVVVVRVDADGRQTDVDAVLNGGEVTAVVDVGGTYVVGVIDTKPPQGCTFHEVAGPVELSADSEAEAIDGVTRVSGDLSITGTISDLRALRCLTHVTGNVTVSEPSALETLSLSYLSVTGGRVSVTGAPLLTSVALTRLRKLGAHELESLVLSTLPELRSVDFRRLAHTPGSIVMAALAETADAPLLVAFSKLGSVGGNLNLSRPSTAADAFEVLGHVGGSVAISTPGARLSGFSALETIGGALSLDVVNAEEVRFDALRSVGAVAGQETWPLSVEVLGSKALREVGFPRLTHAAGSVSLRGGSSEAALELELALTRVDGALSVELASETADVSGLAGLTHVAGDLRLKGRFPAVSLPLLELVGGALSFESGTAQSFGAEALGAIGAGLVVRASPALTDVALGALTAVNVLEEELDYALDLRSLPALASLDLSALAAIHGNAQFYALGDGALDADLDALTRVHGDLIAELVSGARFDTSSLTTIDGSVLLWDLQVPLELAQVAAIGGQFNLQGGDLTELDLSGLTSIGGASPLGPGSITLVSLSALERVDLGSLTAMPSHFRLEANGDAAETPLSLELGALTAIGGDLEITETNNLESADAFGSLNSIAGDLLLTENDVLARLDGFYGLSEVGGNLTISRNALLPTCAAEILATHLDGMTFDGTVSISYNLPDSCN